MNTQFSVTSCGAIGDGKADDSAAIQAALDKAAESNGTVFFPDGTYCCADDEIRVSMKFITREIMTAVHLHDCVDQLLGIKIINIFCIRMVSQCREVA